MQYLRFQGRYDGAFQVALSTKFNTGQTSGFFSGQVCRYADLYGTSTLGDQGLLRLQLARVGSTNSGIGLRITRCSTGLDQETEVA